MTRYREIVRKVVGEEVKKRIVAEIESGRIGQCEAARLYGISRTAIHKWLKEYGKLRYRTRIVEVVMKDQQDKVKELQQALADAHLKLLLYDKMLELAGKEYKADLKKNFSTQASELLRGKATPSKDCAK
jgi:transposase-like protein